MENILGLLTCNEHCQYVWEKWKYLWKLSASARVFITVSRSSKLLSCVSQLHVIMRNVFDLLHNGYIYFLLIKWLCHGWYFVVLLDFSFNVLGFILPPDALIVRFSRDVHFPEVKLSKYCTSSPSVIFTAQKTCHTRNLFCKFETFFRSWQVAHKTSELIFAVDRRIQLFAIIRTNLWPGLKSVVSAGLCLHSINSLMYSNPSFSLTSKQLFPEWIIPPGKFTNHFSSSMEP